MKKWKGLLFGILYGLTARAILTIEFFSDQGPLPTNGLMSFSFLFLVPFVIGLITAYYNTRVTKAVKIVALSMPLFAIIGVILTSVITGVEGIICALMALPVFALMALLGGLIGIQVFKRNTDKVMISLLMFVPFIVAPLERYVGSSDKIFTEETTIVIHAGAPEVWGNVTRVHEITKEENRISLFQVLGFPRPIKAELDTVAVGGIRKAAFDRGLFFMETVTQVVPEKVLAFNIKADPASTPPTALDEHVMVGGKYFDVMEGKYEIEPISRSEVRLHLTSKFRLSTNFNFYSGLWSKLIMRDIQNNILRIVKERSEQK